MADRDPIQGLPTQNLPAGGPGAGPTLGKGSASLAPETAAHVSETPHEPTVAPGTPVELVTLLGPPGAPGDLGRIGPYRVLAVLGTGGMGVVFRAEDEQLRRPVALKVMRPDAAAGPQARERFLREARSAAALEHEHIVPVYHVGEAGGAPFLAMPLLRGESLEDRLQRASALPVPEVLRIGRQIAHGLAYAHGKGVIHRDIKPANIWLEETPDRLGDAGPERVRLLDFGLARGPDDAALTTSGRCSVRRRTWPRSRPAANRPRRPATCSAWARCCTGCVPAGSRSRVPTRWRSCRRWARRRLARCANSPRQCHRRWRSW
jgi:serine/threonine protein kinase